MISWTDSVKLCSTTEWSKACPMSLCSTHCVASVKHPSQEKLCHCIWQIQIVFNLVFFGACLSHEVANLFFNSAYRFVTCIFCHSHQAGPEVAWWRRSDLPRLLQSKNWPLGCKAWRHRPTFVCLWSGYVTKFRIPGRRNYKVNGYEILAQRFLG